MISFSTTFSRSLWTTSLCLGAIRVPVLWMGLPISSLKECLTSTSAGHKSSQEIATISLSCKVRTIVLWWPIPKCPKREWMSSLTLCVVSDVVSSIAFDADWDSRRFSNGILSYSALCPTSRCSLAFSSRLSQNTETSWSNEFDGVSPLEIRARFRSKVLNFNVGSEKRSVCLLTLQSQRFWLPIHNYTSRPTTQIETGLFLIQSEQPVKRSTGDPFTTRKISLNTLRPKLIGISFSAPQHIAFCPLATVIFVEVCAGTSKRRVAMSKFITFGIALESSKGFVSVPFTFTDTIFNLFGSTSDQTAAGTVRRRCEANNSQSSPLASSCWPLINCSKVKPDEALARADTFAFFDLAGFLRLFRAGFSLLLWVMQRYGILRDVGGFKRSGSDTDATSLRILGISSPSAVLFRAPTIFYCFLTLDSRTKFMQLSALFLSNSALHSELALTKLLTFLSPCQSRDQQLSIECLIFPQPEHLVSRWVLPWH